MSLSSHGTASRLSPSKQHLAALSLALAGLSSPVWSGEGNLYQSPYAGSQAPLLDGLVDAAWEQAPWDSLPYSYLPGSPMPDRKDLDVRYKALWNRDGLYLLVKVVDDSVSDRYRNPLSNWWNDDCVEIFLDEDRSGGDHQYSASAWAYHVSTLGEVVDYGEDLKPHLYNDHVKSVRNQAGDTTYWEMSVAVYDSTYTLEGPNAPVTLTEGKRMGFTLAYCDNDGGTQRESFVGSVNTPEHLANEGYLNADGFGTLELLPPATSGIKSGKASTRTGPGLRPGASLGADGRVRKAVRSRQELSVGRELPDDSRLRLALP